SPRWAALGDALLARPAVDLLIQRTGKPGTVAVRSAARGTALLSMTDGRYDYDPTSGDPLGIGRALCRVSSDEAYDATIETDYPDSVVQILHLALAPRSGEIILSAARDWD